MSQSLVRRGLDLYKDDISVTVSKAKVRNSEVKSEEALTHLVGTNKKGFRRKLKRLQEKKTTATLKDKKIKPNEDVLDFYKKRDPTEENVKALNFMQLLNQDEKHTMAKAADLHDKKLKRKSKKAAPPITEPQGDTAFTEQEFEQFFKEYNFT